MLAAGSHVRLKLSRLTPMFLTVKAAVNPLLKLLRLGPVPLTGVTTTALSTLGQIVMSYLPWPSDWPSANNSSDALPVVDEELKYTRTWIDCWGVSVAT